MITLEDNNFCEYCGDELHNGDDITIREGCMYHTECLPENLNKDENNENEN